MKTITFYGYSDDNVVFEDSANGTDEVSAWGRNDAVHRGYFDISAEGSTIEVHVVYAGSWAFAICPQDDDYDNMPLWLVKREFGTRVSYSETLTIEMPDSAKITWVA